MPLSQAQDILSHMLLMHLMGSIIAHPDCPNVAAADPDNKSDKLTPQAHVTRENLVKASIYS